jgi:hypothetical protein
MKKKDKNPPDKTSTFSRRSFAKGMTAVGLGAFIPNILSPIQAAAEEYSVANGKWLREQVKKTPIVREVDVLVVGGGAAGTAAALAAARMGASTVVVEFFGSLGGNGTNGMVSNYCGISTTGPGSTGKQLVKGIGGDIITALAAIEPSAMTTPKAPSFNPETLKRVLDQMSAGANLDILYYTQFTEPIMDKNRVIGAIIENKGGRQAILAKRVVDASGDGDVVARAGAPFTLGDGIGHNASDYQATDLVFQVANVASGTNTGLIGQAVAAASDAELASYLITRKAVITMGIKVPGCYWFNWNNIAVDGDKTDPDYLTKAAIAGRESAAGLMRFLHDKIPGFENAKIIATAPKIGLRESRRFTGDYMLTKDDILGAKLFDDSIGANAWPLEIVTATGRTFQYLGGDKYYTIPYRCLLPQGVENVVMAGRFMSGTHDALASYRVMGPAMVMGHAAGVAAVLAARHNYTFRQLSVKELQTELAGQNAFLGFTAP